MTIDAALFTPSGSELDGVIRAEAAGAPVMLTGPTGCGKTRLVEQVARTLGRELVTVTCHDDLTTADLLGRFLVTGGDVTWVDGPLTRAMRQGAVCYLDEIIEARRDTLAALHSVADHRRSLYLDRTGDVVEAAPGFFLICSYNPRNLGAFKQLAAPLRQRFVTIELGYLEPEAEARVVASEAGADITLARRLTTAASALRRTSDPAITEVPSTRMLVNAARLVTAGTPEDEAVERAVIAPLELGDGARTALRELLHAATTTTNGSTAR
jgi:nitric oxide reductase NorQ protein